MRTFMKKLWGSLLKACETMLRRGTSVQVTCWSYVVLDCSKSLCELLFCVGGAGIRDTFCSHQWVCKVCWVFFYLSTCQLTTSFSVAWIPFNWKGISYLYLQDLLQFLNFLKVPVTKLAYVLRAHSINGKTTACRHSWWRTIGPIFGTMDAFSRV